MKKDLLNNDDELKRIVDQYIETLHKIEKEAEPCNIPRTDSISPKPGEIWFASYAGQMGHLVLITEFDKDEGQAFLVTDIGSDIATEEDVILSFDDATFLVCLWRYIPISRKTLCHRTKYKISRSFNRAVVAHKEDDTKFEIWTSSSDSIEVWPKRAKKSTFLALGPMVHSAEDPRLLLRAELLRTSAWIASESLVQSYIQKLALLEKAFRVPILEINFIPPAWDLKKFPITSYGRDTIPFKSGVFLAPFRKNLTPPKVGEVWLAYQLGNMGVWVLITEFKRGKGKGYLVISSEFEMMTHEDVLLPIQDGDDIFACLWRKIEISSDILWSRIFTKIPPSLLRSISNFLANENKIERYLRYQDMKWVSGIIKRRHPDLSTGVPVSSPTDPRLAYRKELIRVSAWTEK